MGRELTGRPNGRPNVEIDWKHVDELLMAGCEGSHIAAFFGIHPDTLYRHAELDKNMSFTAYKQQKRAKGDAMLHHTQFKMALEKDRGMLIWLGKQRLAQKEDPKSVEGFNGELKDFMEYMKKKYGQIDQTKGEQNEENHIT